MVDRQTIDGQVDLRLCGGAGIEDLSAKVDGATTGDRINLDQQVFRPPFLSQSAGDVFERIWESGVTDPTVLWGEDRVRESPEAVSGWL